MDNNRFFLWLGRVNAILFLVVLLGAASMLGFAIASSVGRGDIGHVEVTADAEGDESPVSLRLGDINTVCGTDVKYVELRSSAVSHGFSSGGYGGEVRNIVFFQGDDLASSWLFEGNSNVIDQMRVLYGPDDDGCDKKKAVAIYYQVRSADTDGDGEIGDRDSVTLALTAVDGSRYTEIDAGIDAVMDYQVDAESSSLTVLAQQGGAIVMKRFSLVSWEKVSERELTRIAKKPSRK